MCARSLAPFPAHQRPLTTQDTTADYMHATVHRREGGASGAGEGGGAECGFRPGARWGSGSGRRAGRQTSGRRRADAPHTDYDNSGWWINCLSGHDLYKSRAELRAFVDECEAAAQDRSMSDVRLRKRQWNELVALLHWTMENCLTEDEAKMRQRWEDDALSDRSNDDGEDESEEWDSDAETGSEEDQEGMENSEGAPEGGSGGGSGRGTHGGGSAEDSEL